MYFVEMQKDGGMHQPGSHNKAGPKYGTGYCDAQCPKSKWLSTGSSLSNTHGRCCVEFDLWEANSAANALTSHPCLGQGYYLCKDKDCDTQCATGGCSLNPYQNGAHNFFGLGNSFSVDTSKPFKLVTQFVTNDGTDHGHVTEIRRLYVQNGKVHQTPKSTWKYLTDFNSLSDNYCVAKDEA